MFDLNGRCALVTGASGSIGGAIARALNERGTDVALSGTRVEVLEALAGELGNGACVVPANLASADSAEQLAKDAEAAVGGVDILVVVRTFRVRSGGAGGSTADLEVGYPLMVRSCRRSCTLCPAGPAGSCRPDCRGSPWPQGSRCNISHSCAGALCHPLLTAGRVRPVDFLSIVTICIGRRERRVEVGRGLACDRGPAGAFPVSIWSEVPSGPSEVPSGATTM